jgi:hypothetical protein
VRLSTCRLRNTAGVTVSPVLERAAATFTMLP